MFVFDRIFFHLFSGLLVFLVNGSSFVLLRFFYFVEQKFGLFCLGAQLSTFCVI